MDLSSQKNQLLIVLTQTNKQKGKSNIVNTLVTVYGGKHGTSYKGKILMAWK